jgi:hypothetical protein
VRGTTCSHSPDGVHAYWSGLRKFRWLLFVARVCRITKRDGDRISKEWNESLSLFDGNSYCQSVVDDEHDEFVISAAWMCVE